MIAEESQICDHFQTRSGSEGYRAQKGFRMTTIETTTHPMLLANQRNAMEWLWQVVSDWTIPIRTQVEWFGPGNGHTTAYEQGRWFLHILGEDDKFKGERVVSFPLNHPAYLVDGVRIAKPLMNCGERLMDIAVLIQNVSVPMTRIMIARCKFRGGFTMILE